MEEIGFEQLGGGGTCNGVDVGHLLEGVAHVLVLDAGQHLGLEGLGILPVAQGLLEVHDRVPVQEHLCHHAAEREHVHRWVKTSRRRERRLLFVACCRGGGEGTDDPWAADDA